MKKQFSFFALCLLLSQIVFAQTYQIGTTDVTFTDAARSNRSVATQIKYPATTAATNAAFASGQFPVVVFGHGFAMSGDNYDNIWQALTPQGYIVVLVNTETSLIGTSHANFAGDLKFVAQAMQTQGSTASSIFYNHVSNKTAIMGHSMGGGATILAAANNTQIATTITLAPANTDPSSIDAAVNTKVPSLVLVGSDDCVVPNADGPTPIYNNFTNIPKAFVSITGGNHCNFSDGSSFNCNFGEGTSGCANSIGDQIRTAANALILPWLNYWLKGNCSALATFNTTAANTATYNQYLQSQLTTPAGPDRNFCAGGSVGLQASPIGSNYSWSPSTGLSSTTVANPTASPTATTTYTLNYTNSNACAVTDQVVVTVKPLPAAAITSTVAPVGSTVTVCSSTGTNFQASPSGSGFTYRWFKNGNFTGFTVTGGNVKKAGTYTVEVTKTSSGCKAMSAPLTVVVQSCKNGSDGSLDMFDNSELYVQAFPNPASNVLNIEYNSSSDAQLSIYDVTGRVTHINQQNLAAGNNTATVDVSELASGQYIVSLSNADTHTTQRLTIIK